MCEARDVDGAIISLAEVFPERWTFTPDSIRKFMWGYVPAKERKELDGDQSISRDPHPLTFVNSFFKWDQRIKAGLDSAPPDPVLRRDLEPVLRRIIELTGREWVGSLLGS